MRPGQNGPRSFHWMALECGAITDLLALTMRCGHVRFARYPFTVHQGIGVLDTRGCIQCREIEP